MSRVPDSWGPYSRTTFRVTCTDFIMTIFSMGIDIIGEISLKSSSGHELILVAIDYFTKWVEAASYARLISFRVASFIRSHIICRYGVSHELISDVEVHFRADVATLLQRYRATLCSLVYGMEAVLPVEIEMGSLRVALEQ
ncbi:hypothetical protein CK203_058580 [Vitis vinifera]|uniref:Integrase catalytic domain-containing protein n=1 Tax=Vitis vinifera TaxID=29760 RepID=A0A438FU56_VITVI|nr:hypothetical protein CK203_058580 [Vitis vinifera]